MLVGFYFLAWQPQTGKLADLENQKLVEETKIKTSKTTLEVLEQKKKDAANVEAELVKIQDKMPIRAELPDLITQLQDIANDAGVNLVSVKPGQLTSKGEFSELQISVSVEGSYIALIDFLKRIEKAQRMLKTSTIDIKVKQYPDLTMNTGLVAFTMGSEETSTTAAPAKSAQVGSGAADQTVRVSQSMTNK